MTKEPHARPVPPDVPPIESFEPAPPADDTIPADAAPSSGAGSFNSPGPSRGAGPFGGGGYGDPSQFETVPVTTGAPNPSGKPIRVGRGTGKLSKRLITAYFAGGLALLLAGTVAVFYLAIKVYGGSLPDRTVTATRDYPTTPVIPSPGGRGTPSKPTAPRAPAPDAFDPSSSPRARFGPERLANGKPYVMQGENNSRFQVTVKAGKFRKSACDEYSVKPKEGGYLTVQLKVKVLEGEPDISEYAFRFQKPDGDWLPSVGGSGCEGNDYGGFVRRLSAGRTYSSTVVFDIPSTKGDIVFVYPLLDVAASWKIG